MIRTTSDLLGVQKQTMSRRVWVIFVSAAYRRGSPHFLSMYMVMRLRPDRERNGGGEGRLESLTKALPASNSTSWNGHVRKKIDVIENSKRDGPGPRT
jgi:hypothetical protein